ncbi:UDP-N-acetylmuramoyl-tripeptide--D-alanyl-D-alanine ligase, partial [Thermodesulfobacteriota bacterium]
TPTNSTRSSRKSVNIPKATQGTMISGDDLHPFSGISIDSRTVSKGDLFIAIKGNVHDGHRFIGDVIEKGGSGFLVEKGNIADLSGISGEKKERVCIAVTDTTEALGDLAAFHRNRSDISVIAITGSNGKTTTRRMTAACMDKRMNVLETMGNFNNQIGLPLTLLRLENSHQSAVLELGMNRPGEIRRLADICKPDIGVITNIGSAHLEQFDSVEGIMHAKGELLEKIVPKGVAVLNADDPLVLRLARETSRKILFFGLSENAAVRAASIKNSGLGTAFTLILPSEQIPIDLKIPGGFSVLNGLAAASVGHLVGLSGHEIKDGLENFSPAPGRMNIFSSETGIHIIDDTYNANPDSMNVAIRTLISLKKKDRAISVVGDMLELGEAAESMHKKIGALSARSGVKKLYAVGKFSGAVAQGATDQGMDPGNIMVGSKDDIFIHLIGEIRTGDWILVKGSRGMGMEEIVRRLKAWAKKQS